MHTFFLEHGDVCRCGYICLCLHVCIHVSLYPYWPPKIVSSIVYWSMCARKDIHTYIQTD